jgi:gas vesicle protein
MVMKEEYTNRKRSILMPVLVGSAAGAGIALLLAPKSGKEIRKDLKRLAANTRDQVAEVIDDGRDLYEEGREVVAGAIKAGKETYDEGTEMIEKLMHKKKERSLMVPILASGIIGAGIALLLASKSGKEVRGDLKRLAADTRDKFVSAIDTGKVLYLRGRKAIPVAVETGKKAYVHEKKKLRHAS